MTETVQPITVVESRKRPRFKMRSEIPATFAGTTAIVTNLSAEGIAIRHSTPIKVNSSGLIRIESEENTAGVSFRGRVRWSHMAQSTTATGTFAFDSGIQIEDVTDAVGGLLGRLIRAFGERDTESMQNKQAAAAQKVKDHATPPAPPADPAPSRTITRDQVLLIREASIKLQNEPDHAQELYDRGRQSLAKREATDGASLHRREVITIWEYLGCKMDFEVIVAVLDAQKA